MGKLNQVKERYIYLSPTVQAGWEDESNINDFEGTKVLGKGAFGKVIRVLHKKSKLTYAVKEINKKNLKLNNMIDQVTNEVKIMYSLNHPYILKLYNHYEDDVNISLVLEYAEGGQLYTKMFRTPEKKFEEKVVAKYIQQLAIALDVVHQKGIIHRDIKPENILLDKNGNVKLADFGWSNFKSTNEIRTTFCGTLDYLAPEMLKSNHEHDFGVDIWSVGVLCYELQTGFSPFAPKNNQKDGDYVDQQTRQNIKSLKYDFPSNFPPLCKDLISKILVENSKDRLSLKNILAHPWITSICGGDPTLTAAPEFINQAKEIKNTKLIDESGKEAKTVFTKEEIFKYSRPDSIINKDFDESAKSNMGAYTKTTTTANFIQNAGTGDLQQQFISQLQTKINKLEASVQSLEIEKQKKDQECKSLKQQLTYLSQTGPSSSSVPDSILERLKEKDEKYENIKKEYDYLKKKFSDQEQFAHGSNRNEYEFDKLKDENLSLKIKVEQLKAQINPSATEGKSALEEMMARINEYREKCEKQREELKKDEILKLNQMQKSGNIGTSGSNSSTSGSAQLGDLDSYLDELRQKQLKQLNDQSKKKN